MSTDGQLVRRLARFVRPYALPLSGALCALLGITLLDVLGPLVVKLAIDDAVVPRLPDQLVRFALLYLVLQLGLLGLRYGQELLLNVVGQNTMHDVRVGLFAHLQSLSIDYFEARSVGQVVTGLTNDIDALDQLLTVGGLALVFDVATIASTAVAMVVLDWRLGCCLILLLLPLVAWLTTSIRRGIRSAMRSGRSRLARLNGLLVEGIGGMRVLQLFNRQEEFYTRFAAANRDMLSAYTAELRYSSWFGPLIGAAGTAAAAGVVWFGGAEVAAGALTLGALVAFLQYVAQVFEPLQRIGTTYNTAQQALTACERIFETFDEQPSVRSPAAPVVLARARGRIELRDVWFGYETDNWVLKGVSLRIDPGERVAIVGRTGAGKTSLVSLIPRLRDVQRGAILLDGVDVRQLPLHELRRAVGIVPQEPVLFSRSVADNIRLNDTSISQAQVHVAAGHVGADSFVEHLPHGFTSLLRERGGGLSSGQRQLLVFARALAFDPRVLILDEATANVDAETDWLIQRALVELLDGRTSIVIAHRLASIRGVDRIVVLDRGEIVEEGQHASLLHRGGVYAHLYKLQDVR